MLHHLPDAGTKRESGKKAQFGNIQAAKMIAEVIRTCLGPRAMLKVGGGSHTAAPDPCHPLRC